MNLRAILTELVFEDLTPVGLAKEVERLGACAVPPDVASALETLKWKLEEMASGGVNQALSAGAIYGAILHRLSIPKSPGRAENPAWAYIREVHAEKVKIGQKQIILEAERRMTADGKEWTLAEKTAFSHYSKRVKNSR